LKGKFFTYVDTRGAEALHTLLRYGTHSLSQEQRCDFARLLLSLEARRPPNVRYLRDHFPAEFCKILDQDLGVIEALRGDGIEYSPTEYFQREGGSIEDEAMLALQQIVDDPIAGSRLINAHWVVRQISERAEPLVSCS
jgi:hypothetical protein